MFRRRGNARRWIAFALVALGVGLVLWASTSAPSYEVCQAERHASHPDKQGLFPEIRYFFVCEGVAVDANGELLTAIATIVMAIFTGTLWWTSSQQGRLTQQSIDLARQEFIATHRPRLRVRSVLGPLDEDDGTVKFVVALVNVGETPANVIADQLGPYWDTGGQREVHIALRAPEVGEDIWIKSGERHNFEYVTMDRFEFRHGAVLRLRGQFVYTDEAGSGGVTRRTGFARYYSEMWNEIRHPEEADPEHEYED